VIYGKRPAGRQSGINPINCKVRDVSHKQIYGHEAATDPGGETRALCAV